MRRPLIFALVLVPLAACGGLSSHVPAATEASAAGGESITNVQEQGVDEGGIVKMHGEQLVVLRRGRLFTVDLAGGAMRMIDVADAFAPGQQPADWYDEMLIHDDTIVVIGFSYHDSATELGIFHVDAGGAIEHRASFQLRSNDYYSSRNYASRLIEDRLVLYVPHHLRAHDRARYPALREIGGAWQPIEGPARVASPTGRRGERVLHTVVMCDLSEESLGCRAQGMIGGQGRSFYVSRDAVYVWITDPLRTDGTPSDAVVYRLPLAGGATGAVRAWGAPTDQLSFDEADGLLRVLVRSEGVGDAMFGSERARGGDVALASIPLASFAPDAPRVDPGATYQPLPRPSSSAPLTNRFVGDHLLYGAGDAWGFRGRARGGTVFAHDVRRGATSEIEIGHAVERIEAMGREAVVIGGDRGDLAFSSIALEGGAARIDRFVLPNASQGETRTHGFFYRDDGEGSGVLGLPVRGGNAGAWQQLWHGSASIRFLRVRSGTFHALGGLDASEEGQVEDRCVASCADWYGNARPIFWRGRVFALLGYELVEGALTNHGIRETARLVLWR